MFIKVKNWFENLFREYILVFTKINETKTSIKEGVSILLTKYNEFCNEIKYSNPKNDFFKPILNEKLKTSISLGKKLPIAYVRKEVLSKAQYFCIELYELGIELYIAKTTKNKIVFNPDDFTENDIQKQKQNILAIIAKEDKQYAEKMKKIELKKQAKESKKTQKILNHIDLDIAEIENNQEIIDDLKIIDEPQTEINNVFENYTNDDKEMFEIDTTIELDNNSSVSVDVEDKKINDQNEIDLDIDIDGIIDDVSFDSNDEEEIEKSDNSIEIIEENNENIVETQTYNNVFEIEEIVEETEKNKLLSDEKNENVITNFDNLDDETIELIDESDANDLSQEEFDPTISLRENDIIDDDLIENNKEEILNRENKIEKNNFDFDDSEIPTIINKYENINQN